MPHTTAANDIATCYSDEGLLPGITSTNDDATYYSDKAEWHVL